MCEECCFSAFIYSTLSCFFTLKVLYKFNLKWIIPSFQMILDRSMFLYLKSLVNPAVALQVWEGRWRVIPFHVLPEWLKDNDYLLHGHRPPMPSFRACFGSIFRIHTETGNIWTHLLGDFLNHFLSRCCLFSNINTEQKTKMVIVFFWSLQGGSYLFVWAP